MTAAYASAPSTTTHGPESGRVLQMERVAVAEIQDRVGSHPPSESDAREEKKSYKLQASSEKPEGACRLEACALELVTLQCTQLRVELPTIGGNARCR